MTRNMLHPSSEYYSYSVDGYNKFLSNYHL